MQRKRLPEQVAEALASRIRQSEWGDGKQLPTEQEFCEEFSVSRVTVRQALKILESRGLVIARQGKGTFVSKTEAMVGAGVQELLSITDSIKQMGLTPSMEYRQREIRGSTEDEAARFDLEADAAVVTLRRIVYADGEIIAFVEDIMPLWVFGASFSARTLTGSVFNYLAEHTSVRPRKAIAHIHAREQLSEIWASDAHLAADLHPFVLLDQMQFDTEERPFMYTKAYFVEGKYDFVVLRLA